MKKLILSAIVMAGLLFTLTTSDLTFAQPYPRTKIPGDYSFGTIASVQDDESGNHEWIVTGDWKGNMIMVNGSEPHSHSIANFNVTDISEENGIKTFNGTSAINLLDGIVEDVPTSVRVLGEGVISIWIDPTRVEEHYGNTPIYGVVSNERGFGPGGPGGPGPNRR
ncbi:MAG: uncharacterized protein K0S67_373 [Nitrososphaeraceae archaeon]|nr:uncharacterized protein [Nitrososphaeraceae archaeon]